MGSVAAHVLVLDAFSLLFRAFFALPPLTTRAGEPTSALYGLSALMLKLLRERRPKGAVFAIDLPQKTFRHQRYAPYKQNRSAPPSSLYRQLARLPELIAAFEVPSFSSAGFEADDVLATLARELAAAGEAPLLVSGDRDVLQLARGAVAVLYAARGVKDTFYDSSAVEQRFGVAPELLPDYAALVGDPSDNLPGVRGVGAQTAAQLVRTFGGVRGVLSHLDEVKPPRLRDSLRECAELLPLWRDLAELRDDVPLAEGPRYAPITRSAKERVRALCTELEFTSLLPRIDEAFAHAT
jgi:DNA polymerase-1